MTTYMDAVTRLYEPNLEARRKSLPDLGQALNTAALELARDLTLERLDMMLARVKSAQDNLTQLRKSLVAERSTGHGTG